MKSTMGVDAQSWKINLTLTSHIYVDAQIEKLESSVDCHPKKKKSSVDSIAHFHNLIEDY